MEQAIENTKVIGGGAVVLGSIALYLAAPKVIRYIQYEFEKYNQNDLNRIKVIQKAYRDYLSREKGTPYSTLERVTPIPELPLFFTMGDKEGKRVELPRLFLEGFSIITDASTWEDHIGLTYLAADVNDLISYICQYQLNREDYIKPTSEDGQKIYKAISELLLGDAAFFYDPINLLCEELKAWLANLACGNLDENSITFINARIQYLNAVLRDPIFNQRSSHQTTFIGFISAVIERLDSSILQCVDLVIKRKSAREYFSELYLDNKRLLRNLIRFLFYLYNDARVIPQTFSIREISQPTLPAYKVALDTISGQLLQLLVNTASFSQAYDLILPQSSGNVGEYSFLKTKSEISEKELIATDSSCAPKKNYYPIFPKSFESNLVHVATWYKVEEDNIHDNMERTFMTKSGIIKECRNSELMREFLLLHGYVEKLSHFCIIINSLHDLAGEAGNLLLFGYASKVVASVLDDAEELLDIISACVNKLYITAHRFFLEFGNHNITASNSKWVEKNYPHINKTYGLLGNPLAGNIGACLKKIRDITPLIKKINHPDYAETIKEKIYYLMKYIESFSGKKITDYREKFETKDKQRSLTLPRTSGFFQENNSDLIQQKGFNRYDKEKEIDKNSKTEEYRLGLEKYKLGNYKEAFYYFKNFIKFLAKEKTSNREMLLRLYTYCGHCLVKEPIFELNCKSSVYYFNQAITFWEEDDGLKNLFSLYFGLAAAYESKGMLSAAISTLSSILEKGHNQNQFEAVIEKARKKIEEILEKKDILSRGQFLTKVENNLNNGPRGK
jgi:hypothetical protein